MASHKAVAVLVGLLVANVYATTRVHKDGALTPCNKCAHVVSTWRSVGSATVDVTDELEIKPAKGGAEALCKGTELSPLETGNGDFATIDTCVKAVTEMGKSKRFQQLLTGGCELEVNDETTLGESVKDIDGFYTAMGSRNHATAFNKLMPTLGPKHEAAKVWIEENKANANKTTLQESNPYRWDGKTDTEWCPEILVCAIFGPNCKVEQPTIKPECTPTDTGCTFMDMVKPFPAQEGADDEKSKEDIAYEDSTLPEVGSKADPDVGPSSTPKVGMLHPMLTEAPKKVKADAPDSKPVSVVLQHLRSELRSLKLRLQTKGDAPI